RQPQSAESARAADAGADENARSERHRADLHRVLTRYNRRRVHQLRILSKHADAYRQLIADARLPDLEIVDADASADVVFGEPSLVAPALARLTNVLWVQATWAGVEPLLDPLLRRDYVLTNARGVFGGLMSEYVLTYILAHERKLLEKYEAQRQ